MEVAHHPVALASQRDLDGDRSCRSARFQEADLSPPVDLMGSGASTYTQSDVDTVPSFGRDDPAAEAVS